MIGNALHALIDPGKDRAAIAIVDRTGGSAQQVTYGELQDRIAFARTRLIDDFGVQKGDRVAIIGANSTHFLAAYFGTMSAGGVAVLVNGGLDERTLNTVVSDAGVAAIVVDEVFAGKLNGLDAIPTIGTMSLDAATERVAEVVDTDESDPALVLFTSGSTGIPKGVVLSHSSQLSALRAQEAFLTLLEGKSTVIAAPLFHMNALTFAHTSVVAHGRMALLRQFSEEAFANSIRDDEVLIVGGVPPMITRLARHNAKVGDGPFDSVAMVVIGSAPLTEANVTEIKALFPNAMVSNGYGTTEIGPGVFGPHPDGLERPTQSIGYPSSNCEVRLSDGEPSDEGVLEVKGPGLMLGYDGRPDLTAEKLKDGWFRTGDVFRRDENGFFYFTGREDDMFVCNGENIYPMELEKVLDTHPEIAASAVVSVEDAVRGRVPVAFVVSTADLTAEAVQDYFTSNAEPSKYPRQVHFLDQLPVNAVNKVDRKQLQQLAEASREDGR